MFSVARLNGRWATADSLSLSERRAGLLACRLALFQYALQWQRRFLRRHEWHFWRLLLSLPSDFVPRFAQGTSNCLLWILFFVLAYMPGLFASIAHILGMATGFLCMALAYSRRLRKPRTQRWKLQLGLSACAVFLVSRRCSLFQILKIDAPGPNSNG